MSNADRPAPRRKSLFCRLGWHRWRCIGFVGLMLSDVLKECTRCGAGQLDMCYGQAWCRYTPEQMVQLKEMKGFTPDHNVQTV